MILTTAALLAIATALAVSETKTADELLGCAADRYRAARVVDSAAVASGVVAAKGMGAIAPAGRPAEAARLRADGDDFRRRANSELSRAQVLSRYPGRMCSID